MKRGRTTIRTPAIDAKIIDGLSEGIPLAVLCREDGMPAPRTVRDWIANDKEFAAAIAGAREDGFDQIAADALAIADETHKDTVKGKDGSEQANTEWITRSRLRVETRLKLLAKWDPKRYGDLLKVGNPDGSAITPELDETAKLTRLAAIVSDIQRGQGATDDAG